MEIPRTIECVECGGVCSLISYLPEDESELDPETPLAYRCRDCMERFDVVMALDDEGD